MTKNTKSNQLKPITIKEFNIDDEDELLDAVMSEPEIDKEWDQGWELVIPNRRSNIKDIFKYYIILPIRMVASRFWRLVFNNRRHARTMRK